MGRRVSLVWVLLMMMGLICGCAGSKAASGEAKAVEYSVVQMGEVPEEVSEMIANQGDQVFQMVYKSDGWIYVMRGYGRQKLSGYSIRITDVQIAEGTLHVTTQLVGPDNKKSQEGGGSNPYFVIKLEDPGCPVTFDDAGAPEDVDA